MRATTRRLRGLLRLCRYDGMIRLQKLLAEAGFRSRRTVEEWIREGRVTIGDRAAQPGDRASRADEVQLDGRKLDLGARPIRATSYSFITSPWARSLRAGTRRAA